LIDKDFLLPSLRSPIKLNDSIEIAALG